MVKVNEDKLLKIRSELLRLENVASVIHGEIAEGIDNYSITIPLKVLFSLFEAKDALEHIKAVLDRVLDELDEIRGGGGDED